MDFIVDLPPSRNVYGLTCRNILVVVDRLSKQKRVIPYDDMLAPALARLFV